MKRKAFIIGAAVAALLTVGGVAIAAWLASGNGSAYSKAGQEAALTTVDASADVTTVLFPNTDASLAIRVVNPNGPLTLTSVQGTGAATVASPGIGTCTTTGVTINQATVDAFIGAGKPLPAGTTSFLIPNGAHMSGASDSGCQTATFQIPIALVGTT